MKLVTVLILAFATAAFAQQQPAPAASQAADPAQQEQKATSPPAAGTKATLYVYRLRDLQRGLRKPSVYIDERELARIENGRFFGVNVDPGRHVVRSTKASAVTLEMKPGQVYYIRVAYEFSTSSLATTLVGPEQGWSEIGQTESSNPKYIKDHELVFVDSMPSKPASVPAPEEQVVVNFDQRKWHVGYETEKGGQRIKEFVLPEETVDNWTELVTVQSFPGAEKRMTAKEAALGMKQRLDKCPKAMWKIIQGDKDEFLYEWQTVDCPGWDNQYEVSKIIKGRTAIHHIAYANRKLPIPEETRGLWIDLIGKAGFPAPRSVVQSTEVSTPQQPEKATAVPGEFVVYEGLKDQFTIAIPPGWAAYDQEQVVFRKTPGLWGIIIFLPAPVAQELKEFGIPKTGISESSAKELLRKAVELLSKVEAGEIPSFLVERVRADRGMSCSGFSEKAEKKLLQTIGRDPIFGKGRNVSERPHADPTTVGACKGLRIRGRGQTSAGGESLVDIYAASDGETLYLFTLRPLAENYAKNIDVFQKAVATARLTTAK